MPSLWSRYSFAWFTGGFFLISLIGHWGFGWLAYVKESQTHNQPPEFYGYAIQMLRETMENWQSEFLQLLWQVGGLAFLLHVGSPQSKEGDDRLEAKVDAILKAVDPNGRSVIERVDRDYLGRHTDEPFMKAMEREAAGR